MLPKKINISKTNTTQNILNNLNEYVVRIDYFDQEGTKSFEDNIPLRCIYNSSDMKLSKTNIEHYYFNI